MPARLFFHCSLSPWTPIVFCQCQEILQNSVVGFRLPGFVQSFGSLEMFGNFAGPFASPEKGLSPCRSRKSPELVKITTFFPISKRQVKENVMENIFGNKRKKHVRQTSVWKLENRVSRPCFQIDQEGDKGCMQV